MADVRIDILARDAASRDIENISAALSHLRQESERYQRQWGQWAYAGSIKNLTNDLEAQAAALTRLNTIGGGNLDYQRIINSTSGVSRSFKSAEESAAAFAKGNKLVEESFFNLEGGFRHIIALFDEYMRGQRGAMVSSASAFLRDTGLMQRAISLVVSPIGAAVAATTALVGALAYLSYETIKDQETIDGVVDRLNLFGNATNETSVQIEGMQNRLRETYNLWDSDSRKLVSSFATIPGLATSQQEALAGMAAEFARVSHGQITLAQATKEFSGAAEKGTGALHNFAERMAFVGTEAGSLSDEIDQLETHFNKHREAVEKDQKAIEEWARTNSEALSMGIMPPSPPEPTLPTETAYPSSYVSQQAEIGKLSVDKEREANQNKLNALISAEADLRNRIANNIGDVAGEQKALLYTEDAIATLAAKIGKEHTQAEKDAHAALISNLELQKSQTTELKEQARIQGEIDRAKALYNAPVPYSMKPESGEYGTVGGAIQQSNAQADTVISTMLSAQGQKLYKMCAELVNQALVAAGLPSSGSALASSFKRYGVDIPRGSERPGDIFYSPPSGEGDTGHVGVVLSQAINGMVRVMSSHMQGPASNPAGVEWRRESGIESFHRPMYASDPIAAQLALDNQKRLVNSAQEQYSLNLANNRLEAEKARTVAEQAKAAREAAAEDMRHAADPGVNELKKAELAAQAQQKIKEANKIEYDFEKETAQNRIANAREVASQTINSASTSSEAKVAAAKLEVQQINSIYDELISSAKGKYKQDETEWTRLQTAKTNAVRQAERQIGQTQKASTQEQIRDIEQRGRIELETERVKRRLATDLGKSSGVGASATIAAAQSEANIIGETAQKEIAILQEVASKATTSGEERIKIEQQIQDITNKTTNEQLADYEKAAQAYEKAHQGLTKFFEGLGSAFESGAQGLLKAFLMPQTEIIHAGLSTIRVSERSTEIRQAIGQMLMDGINSAAKGVESAIGNMLGNALFKGVAGSNLSEKFGNWISGAFGGGAPQVSSYVTTTASLQAFNAALTQATGTLLGHSASTATATGVETTRTAVVGTNTVTTVGNTVATSTNTLATQTNSAAQSSSGVMGFLKGIPLVGGLFNMFERGGIVPSAAGGMIAAGPSGGSLAILHPNEMVLPANISAAVQSMTNSGSSGSSSSSSLNAQLNAKALAALPMYLQMTGGNMQAAKGLDFVNTLMGAMGPIGIVMAGLFDMVAAIAGVQGAFPALMANMFGGSAESGLRSIANQGNLSGASTSNNNLNYSPTLNMSPSRMNRDEFASMLSGHASDMMGMARQMVRSGFRG